MALRLRWNLLLPGDERSNCLAIIPHPTQGNTPELHVLHVGNAGNKLQDLLHPVAEVLESQLEYLHVQVSPMSC